MKILSYSLQTISKTENLRMGLSFAKESHALFLKKYSKNCPLRLSEICIIEKGKVITEEDSSDGIIPVVAGGKTLAYYHNKYNREKDVITISASGAYSGFVNYWNTPIWASDCVTVRSKDENAYIAGCFVKPDQDSGKKAQKSDIRYRIPEDDISPYGSMVDFTNKILGTGKA